MMDKFEEHETKKQLQKRKYKFSKKESFVMEVCAIILTILSIGTFVVFVITMATIAIEITTS
ncbi:MAG: hypothetical protein K2H93_03150 [Oscillospiraceae bacterium]|nr:hypothetical protein [Oscillospiraceae bacterium]